MRTKASTLHLLLVLLAGCDTAGASLDRGPDGGAGDDGATDRTGSSALTVPTDFVDTTVVTGLADPTSMAIAPDGRIFICEQTGAIRVVQNGALLPAPFATIDVHVTGEAGLLGITFDPSFATNHYVYVYHTEDGPPLHNRVVRLTANGNVAVPGSLTPIFDLEQIASADAHNGGALHFGSDGMLYIAVGDNSRDYPAPGGPAPQRLDNIFGKLLRIQSNGTIPTTNPFYNQTTGINRAIWARGLRNPFSFGFQPGTGRLYINDVGKMRAEEINLGEAGANYGWPQSEGDATAPDRSPVHWYCNRYPNCPEGGSAIVGGTFYNPANATFPSQYVGNYFFVDFAGWIGRLNPATGQRILPNFATDLASPVYLLTGPDGALYYLSRGDATNGIPSGLHRIQYVGSGGVPPTITGQPQNRTVPVGSTANFQVIASGSPAPTYQWRRAAPGSNTFQPISGATAASYTTPATALSENGARFEVVVTNTHGSVTSARVTLTVTTNNAPVATITTPPAGSHYTAGTTVSFAGTGTDTEDGTLPASAFEWRVDFHHSDHTHPVIISLPGVRNGSFTPDAGGETATDVFYRIHLTVRDAAGLTHHVFRDVLPTFANLTVRSSPAGLNLIFDTDTVPHDTTRQSVVGKQRILGAPSPQTLNGVQYVFSSWSDGGAQSHVVATPAANTIYTATFVAAPTLPAAPSNLTGAAASSTAADLSWQDNSANEVTFRVERATGNGAFAEVGNVAANVRTFRASGLAASTTYSFRVRARNAAGDSGYSNVVTVTTPANPGGGELVLNPSFEVWSGGLPASWSLGAGATVTQLTSGAHSGSFAVQATMNGWGANLRQTVEVNRPAGTTYTLSAVASYVSGDTSPPRLDYVLYFADGGSEYQVHEWPNWPGATGSGVPHSITFTPTRPVARIAVLLRNNTPATSVVRFDSVSLTAR